LFGRLFVVAECQGVSRWEDNVDELLENRRDTIIGSFYFSVSFRIGISGLSHFDGKLYAAEL